MLTNGGIYNLEAAKIQEKLNANLNINESQNFYNKAEVSPSGIPLKESKLANDNRRKSTPSKNSKTSKNAKKIKSKDEFIVENILDENKRVLDLELNCAE